MIIFLKIWQKTLLKEITKKTLFFLFSIFIIYFLIDFSLHSAKIFHNAAFFKILKYYTHHLFINLNLFLSLSFLLAIIKVVFSMNIKNELLALQISGISKNKFAIVLMFIAIILSFICYLNFEFIHPKSKRFTENFKSKYFRKNKRKKTFLSKIVLQDGSKLIYQKYNPDQNKIFDVFWIESKNSIWHMKNLNLEKFPFQASYIDHLIKKDGLLQKKESFKNKTFNIKIEKKILRPIEERSISSLFSQIINKKFSSQQEKTNILSYLTYRLSLPILPILILFGILPFSMKFSKNLKSLKLIAISLFSFISFLTVIDAILILSENGTISPFFIFYFITTILIILLINFFKPYKLNKKF